MKSITNGLSALCAFAWTLAYSSASANTPIGETNYSSDTVWELSKSPYIINGNVQVNSGATLKIEAGVIVQFSGDFKIEIASSTAGTLRAIGNAKNNIVFTTTTGSPMAASIQFQDASTDATFDTAGNFSGGSILEYVTVEKIGSTQGAIVLNGAHPFISHALIRNNQASGLYAFNTAALFRIENSTFDSNVSPANGGAINITGAASSDVRLTGNTVTRNAAGIPGTTLGLGGGIYLSNEGISNLSDNQISGNEATSSGGGVYIAGNGTAATLRDSIYDNKTSGSGGGIFFSTGPATMESDTVRGNIALNRGGGIYSASTALNVNHSLVVGNHNDGMGGGIFLLENSSSNISHSVFVYNDTKSHSGGVDIHGPATVNRCVIAGNTSVLYGAAVGFSNASGTLSNSTITQNSGGPTIEIDLPSTVQGNTITANSTGSATVMIKKDSQFGSNNLFANTSTWDLYSWVSGTIFAPSIWWGPGDIGNRIGMSDPSNIIDLNPIANNIITTNPISPPSGVTVTPTATSFLVSWSPNPETGFDLSRYRVYWGPKSSATFTDWADVYNGTQFEIPALASGDYVVAVTAIDANYDANVDDPATPVNENQTNGNESWYSVVLPLSVVESDYSVAITASTNNAAGIDHLKVGDALYYVVTVTNGGPTDAVSSFNVKLDVGAGIEFNPNLPKAGCSVSAQSQTCSRPALTTGNSLQLVFDATVTGGMMSPVNATATVSSPDDGVTTNDTASTAICVKCPDLSTTWTTAPTMGPLDGAVNYGVSVKNLGPAVANNTALTIALPAGIDVSNVTGPCTLGTDSITCDLGNLAAGGVQNISFSATTGTVATLAYSAAAATPDNEPSKANNNASITTTIKETADLAITFSDNGTTAAQKQTYTVTVTNAGPSVANAAIAKITLPGGLIGNADPQLCAQVDIELNCVIGRINVGASVSLTFTTVFSDAGSFELTALAGAEEFDPNMVNNTAKVTTVVNPSQNPEPSPDGGSGGGGGGALNIFLLALLLLRALRERPLRAVRRHFS